MSLKTKKNWKDSLLKGFDEYLINFVYMAIFFSAIILYRRLVLAEYGIVLDDYFLGFIKALVFAVIVTTVCCYQGYFTHMRTDSYGAKGVSLSTTSAVVLSCVLILVADYVVTSFLI